LNTTASVLPRIVIAIPTFNRAHILRRAIDSALSQDYPNLRIVISDNASTDDTALVIQSYVAADSRVASFRHPVNVGATRNFAELLERATGELFMWLADDDWLEPGYVSHCARSLAEQRDAVLVGGVAKYYQQGVLKRTGKPTDCASTGARQRVLSYYRQVDDNGLFYGLMRRDAAVRAGVVNCLGGDWLFVAAIAYQGNVLTNRAAVLNRSLGGTSESASKMTAMLNLPSWQARMPITLPLAGNAAKDILVRSPVYRDMGTLERVLFSSLVFCWLCALKPVQELRRRLGPRATTSGLLSEGEK
jgi:glycosyltransferase involved in cell wall biosynthesis